MEQNTKNGQKKKGSGLFLCCMLLCAAIFAFSAYKLYEYWNESRQREQYAQQLMENAVTVSPPVREETLPEKERPESPEEKLPLTPITVDFDLLAQQNEDIVGWIYSEGTPINYPVAQAGNNDYYLRRLLDGTYNYGGTLFMDYRNAADATDWNTIIYGHSMQDDTMFGSVLDYKKQAYYDEHPVLWYFTPQASYRVELIGGYLTDAYSEVYILPQTPQERDALAALVQQRSTFESGVTWEEDSRLLMLGTCSYETDQARYVLLGKLVPVEVFDAPAGDIE